MFIFSLIFLINLTLAQHKKHAVNMLMDFTSFHLFKQSKINHFSMITIFYSDDVDLLTVKLLDQFEKSDNTEYITEKLNVQISRVNCDKGNSKDLCIREGIRTFPTVKYYLVKKIQLQLIWSILKADF